VGELEKGKISSVKVYPNPARETINVDYINESNVNAVVEIRTLTGALVRSQALGNDQAFGSRAIDVADLPAGLYILTVKSGESKTSMKFAKAK
jgi:hypothetical protein